MNGDSLVPDAWFALPAAALFFGILALAPLGSQVLMRGVVFIDLAVAQAAAAAALWAAAIVDHPGWLVTHIFAFGGALGCAAAVATLARRWRGQREALIGLLYVMGASVALLGARQDPHGRERLSELLAADVLWVQSLQVGVLLACAAGVQMLGRERLSRDRLFFPVFAVVSSLAVPALGLFVVFACLIAPALWQRAGATRIAAWGGAALACGLGLALSWLLDAPSGACVVLGLAAFGILSAALRRAPLARTESLDTSPTGDIP